MYYTHPTLAPSVILLYTFLFLFNLNVTLCYAIVNIICGTRLKLKIFLTLRIFY